MAETRDGRFLITVTNLPPLAVVERRQRGDDRGFLSRLYSIEAWEELGFTDRIVDVNHTLTRQRGTLRGMHYQTAPSAEDKFVSVIRGSVFDVALDLRRGSTTLGHWHGETLSAENRRAMLIPKGFAHGFQTLEDDCELIYFHTAAYDAEHEGGVNALDPALGITWPLPILTMSDRDRGFAPLAADFPGIDS
ncbi:dTDP-4-dehydrorhamnose 3,5-epimerase [Sphingomonas sp. M1-B02]|uniref:dTDP-4-dehydrorhamnose 3,5-epimerase n=1 Tax=Sphingomonas sp. M1-B02 TaxID=3114300 RepID=UPI00223FE99C|nr:dTDP-4-dehydrorhamnose 3,5-epimerase [Sphingomonas sp. S6-11]UZK65056.1 dTDP-4-dehydrorhamnose 3,5-epimerase [Sphingomonas sp. S6-11]